MDAVQAHDEGALFFFQTLHRPWLTPLMKFLTLVGNKYTLAILLLVFVLLFIVARRPRTALFVLLACLLAFGECQGLKTFVHRPRPDEAWHLVKLPHSPSFPSGHSFNSMAVFGAAGLTAARALRRRLLKVLLVMLSVGLPVGIGLSRPYLGVHYPLDVLTGLAGGLGCALLAVWADQRWGYHPGPVVASNT